MPVEASRVGSRSEAPLAATNSLTTPRAGIRARLECVKGSLSALRDLAAQEEGAESDIHELASLLDKVLHDLNELHEAIGAQLQADARTPRRYEAILRGHILRSSERQLFEMARLAETARRADDGEGIRRAAWVAALVMTVEVDNLAGDLVSVCAGGARSRP